MADPLRDAATRLEAAVERLSAAASRPSASRPDGEVAELGRRLDAALGRLRAVLARDEGESDTDDERADPSRPEQED